ncbi:MAG: BatA domain-containing protein, partial [Pseudomonadota bacterium]
PLLYFLLRITPPRPALVPFPPLRLILDFRPRTETASRTPWWLVLLRLAIAASLIFAMAGPVLNPPPAGAAREGSLLIVLDDGWPAAPGWKRRIAAAARRIAAAERNSQLAAVVAASEAGRDIASLEPAKAQVRLRALKPVPFVPDRLPVFSAIEKYAIAQQKKPAIVWIADGLERGHAREFAGKLAAVSGELTVVTDSTPIRALAGAQNQTGRLDVRVLRAALSGPRLAGPERGVVRALDRRGLALGEASFDFGAANETQASFEMPVELRNEIARLEIAREHSAAAVFLLDERWRRRRIGLVSGETADIAQPLLAPSYYLTKALSPFADIREARPAVTDPIGSL